MIATSHGMAGDGRSMRALWLAFAVLHAVLFFLDLYPESRRPFGDEVMYRALAESAAHGGPGTPELLWPPLYVWLITPFAWLGAGWAHAVALFQVLLLAVSALVFHDVLMRMTAAPAAARLGQAFMLLDPHLAAYAHYAWPEVLHIALLVLLFWLLMARPSGRTWWMAAGITAGTICLTKSVLEPFLPVLALPLAREIGWRSALLRTTGIVSLAALVLLPIAVTNWRTQGVFIVADSALFNLWVGLNADGRRSAVDDSAGPEYLAFEASAGAFAGRQQILADKVIALVRDRGVLSLVRDQWPKQYFRLFDSRTFLTEQLAGGPFLARGVGYREPGAFVSFVLRAWNAAFYALVLAAAGVGLCTSRLSGRPWSLALFALFLYGLGLFFVVEARSRYRIPLMLPLWTAAALALVFRARGVSKWRVAAGGLVSTALLAFAFGADTLP